MTAQFRDLQWHDAVLLSIEVDRNKPGHSDEVRLYVRWQDARESCVRFVGCYAFDAKMNFGVVAPETIRMAAEASDEDELLLSVREKWRRLGVRVEGLNAYFLETNSTASLLRIVAQGCEVTPLPA